MLVLNCGLQDVNTKTITDNNNTITFTKTNGNEHLQPHKSNKNRRTRTHRQTDRHRHTDRHRNRHKDTQTKVL